jgi:hypothetical protein
LNEYRGPFLRVVWERPGFFLGDPRLLVTLDGTPIFDGGFRGGFDVCVPVAPGWHRVVTAIPVLGTSAWRSRDYSLDFTSARSMTLVLEYSRVWGNFASRPKVVPW